MLNKGLFAILKKAFVLLSLEDRRKISKITFAQVLLGFLDLFGLALVGLVASLASSGVNSRQPSELVNSILNQLNLNTLTFQSQTAILASITIVIFIVRSILSILFAKRMYYFLGNRCSRLASHIYYKLLEEPLAVLDGKSRQQIVFSLSTGIEIIFLRIIGPSTVVISDLFLLLIVLSGISVISLPMTIISMIVVGLTIFALHRFSTSRARLLGSTYSSFDVASRETLSDSLFSIREIKIRGRYKFFVDEFYKDRAKVSNAFAEMNFIPVQSKYIIESSIILTGFIIAGFQFLVTDAQSAIATLAVFLVAGSRLAPAALRIQQGLVGINNSWGVADTTLNLIDRLKKDGIREIPQAAFSDNHKDFFPTISVHKLNFAYPNSDKDTIIDVSFKLDAGEFVSLIGPSGAGKSTLMDLILNLISPNKGKVMISGLSPTLALQKWPGGIGYIPQEIHLFNRSIVGNIALGYDEKEIDESKIWEALENAQLYEFVSSLPQGIHTQLGEKGLAISGGQRQRIGIARALFTKPLLLLMDEATSSLDVETEYNFTEFIQSLKGKVSILMISHKLSSIKIADKVIFLKDGQIYFQGTVDELLKQNIAINKYLIQ